MAFTMKTESIGNSSTSRESVVGPSGRLIYILNHYSADDSSHFPHIVHLLQVIAEQGSEVTLIVEKSAGDLPAITHPRVSVRKLRSRTPGIRHLELFVLLLRLISEGFSATFVRIAAPAAIVAALAHRLAGGKAFLWQSGTTHTYDTAQPLSIRKVRWWVGSYLPSKLARQLVHHFVTGPEAMVDYYAETVGVPRKKIRLLYNDVQIDRFVAKGRSEDKARLLRDLRLPADAVLLLLVHRLSPVRKTLMYLEPTLAALQHHRNDWVLVIAGEGSELGAAKALVARFGLEERVRFLGAIPNRDIHRLYGAADLFIHPTFTEGFPRVLIEAMASSLPIITTNAGGTAQLLGPRQANYMVDKDEPAKFAEKTLALLQAREEWESMAIENFQQVQRFSTPEVAAMYRRVLFS